MPYSNPDFARPKSSYRKLRVFQKTEAIFDLTYFFVKNYLDPKDRTRDQMLQAARSGKQNIAEGRTDARSSAEMEIKLYGVSSGSLHELLNDYLDFARTREIPVWEADHPRMKALLSVCAENNDSKFYMLLAPKLTAEEFCNMTITLIHQAITMLDHFIPLIKEDFLKNGGIKEQMFKARIDYRNNQGKNKNS